MFLKIKQSGKVIFVAALFLAALITLPACQSDRATTNVASPDLAAETGGRQVVIAGADAPGPDELDKVFLRQYGPKSARTILVLAPGSPGGQGNFAALAPALVERVPDLAVWAIDRRGNALEDASGFRNDPKTAAEYYFGKKSVGGRIFEPVTPQDAAYVSEWGANVAIDDLHKVVSEARAGGKRKVILGGHSMGAVTTPVYAVWDFAGRPGYRDLSGLLMIDGMQLGAFDSYNEGTTYSGLWRTEDDARRGLETAALQKSPFAFGGWPQGLPGLWAIGVIGELACKYALDEPGAPSALQEIEEEIVKLVPVEYQVEFRKQLKLPTFPVTNEAFFGLLNTNGLIPLLEMRTGSLAPEGNPRPWVDGPNSSVARVCRTFTQQPGNGLEWYYPARLDHDLFQALGTLRPTEATRYLEMRPRHLASVNTPTFVFETGLTKGGVLRAAKLFIEQTNVREYVFASDQNMGHFDPLVDDPANNKFIQEVVPWLRGITAK